MESRSIAEMADDVQMAEDDQGSCDDPAAWFADRELVDHSVRDPWEAPVGDGSVGAGLREYDSTPELRDPWPEPPPVVRWFVREANDGANQETPVSEDEAFRRMNDRIDGLVTDPLIADDLRRYEAERRQADRVAAIETTGGTLTGAFPAGYLGELRDDWSTVQDAAQIFAQRSAELNRRLSEG